MGSTIPGDWHDLVVLCAANNWDDVKLADRHLAERLCEHLPVLYVDPPLSHLTPRHRPELRSSLTQPRLRVVGPNLARLTPVMPPRGQRRGIVRLTNLLIRHSMSRAVARLGGEVRALVATWLLLDVYGSCGERTTVYWWQDDPGGAAELWGIDRKRALAGERRLAAGADLVVVANEAAIDRWGSRGPRVRCIPYGCDAERFARVDETQPAGDVHLAAPVAGFIGHLNSRTDLALLESVAQRGTSLLLVGPRDPGFATERVDRLLERRNVQWVGPRSFDELPGYLRWIDVGLVPYGDSAFNRWCYPLKTLEYLSAGRPVIATPLPATCSLGSDLVTLATEPAAFADAVELAFPSAHVPGLVEARRAFAGGHSWERRAEAFADALLTLPSRSTGVPPALARTTR
jgi:glycosyltransferase involved in cell wall biosynthesis